jgi:hypothetical protein
MAVMEAQMEDLRMAVTVAMPTAGQQHVRKTPAMTPHIHN